MQGRRAVLALLGLCFMPATFAASGPGLVDYQDYVPAAGLKRTYSYNMFPACPGVCPNKVVDVVKHVAPDKLQTTTTYFFNDGSKTVQVLVQQKQAQRLMNLSRTDKQIAPDGSPLGSMLMRYKPAFPALISIELNPPDAASSYYDSHALGQWSYSYQTVVQDTDTVSPPSILGVTAEGLEDLTVPAGTFHNCLKLRREYIGGQNLVWYCPGIGLTKMVAGSVIQELIATTAP